MSIVSTGELRERFYVTKLYGEYSNQWPKSTTCLVNCNVKEAAFQETWECITGTDIEVDDWKRFDNTIEESSKQHAETNMITYLNSRIFRKESGEPVYTDVKIKIYINYSPCSDCVNPLQSLNLHV